MAADQYNKTRQWCAHKKETYQFITLRRQYHLANIDRHRTRSFKIKWLLGHCLDHDDHHLQWMAGKGDRDNKSSSLLNTNSAKSFDTDRLLFWDEETVNGWTHPPPATFLLLHKLYVYYYYCYYKHWKPFFAFLQWPLTKLVRIYVFFIPPPSSSPQELSIWP